MNDRKVRVAVNGYGVIGKRIADAVVAQTDMELVGVADVITDWRIKVAREKGYPIYGATPQALGELRAAGLPVAGNLADLLGKVDIVADATPKQIAAQNLARYRAAGVKAIFQGGEKHALKQAGLLGKARGVLVRRATDPWESDHTGVMNTVVPEKTIPSHQGPDAQTVDPALDVVTMAVVAAHTTSHLHAWQVGLTRPASREEVLAAFRAAPRIAFLQMADGMVALNSTLELMADLGRPRGDMWEVGLWADGVTVVGTELFYNYQVYNQAIVVPETIDAIRSLTAVEENGATSILQPERSRAA